MYLDKELLLRYLKCETTPGEEAFLLDILDSSPELRTELVSTQLTMEALALGDFAASEDDVRNTSSRRRARSFRVNGIVRWSASVAAVFVVAAGIGWGIARGVLDKWSHQATVVEMPAGQRMSIILPDGTEVCLNSGARLEYPAVFTGKDRRVKISGEAMFNVAHDARRPFIVETFACEIEALGTRFNVIAEPEAADFSTALFEGKLKVSPNDTPDVSVIISPNEMAMFEDDRLLRSNIPDYDDYLWTEGVLNLDNLSFEEAMHKFEMYYGVHIVFERKVLPRKRFNGKIRVSDGIDYALQLLMSTSDFKYCKSGDRNTIYIR